jgi:hypothetical protein
MTTSIVATYVLLFLVLPVWILAGLADYFCHRASRIECNAGPKESVLHLLQLGLVGMPVVAGLFLEVTRSLLIFMAVAILLHHAVAYWDVRYANSAREVSPLEQMIHSFLELLPITAFLLVWAICWPQLIGAADEGLRLRDRPLPPTYVACLLGAAAVLNLLPYLEELWRTSHARRS